ncbi:hypothetical protein AVEN_10899-1 [Araneus ventricosus]|uniref:Uncharacterized protein n=1 Tax=Araneus ventricosus TaxID=182803 RepID=A0A4Y2RGP1_ARAVE|nr:hypothetical protein AVEN_10899-1 [Araneus ventricosus]
MASQPENCVKSLKQLLMHLSQKKTVLDIDCDGIIFQYKNFLQNIVNMYPSAFQSFKPNTRLDIFFNEYMSKGVKDFYNKIWPVMKIIFTLSHGKLQLSIRRSIRPLFQGKRSTARLYDVITCITTRFALAYIVFPFILLECHASLAVYAKLYFAGHWLALAAIFLLPYFVPAIVRTTPVGNKKDHKVD